MCANALACVPARQVLSRTRESVTSIVESLGDRGHDVDGASGSNSMGRRGSVRDNGEGDGAGGAKRCACRVLLWAPLGAARSAGAEGFGGRQGQNCAGC